MALVQEIPSLTSEMRACVAAVLGKTAIDEVATQAAIQALLVMAALSQIQHCKRNR